jgi:mannose-6-phosphate isomerase-like protein (cupin superfamily)
MRKIWGLFVMTSIAATALAQSGGLNHYSASQLQQMAHKLEQQEGLRTTGSASETLEKYSDHSTMLTVRTASGGAEVHGHYADIFFVVDGEATLTTGGAVLNPTNAGPGETRGTAVQGGVQQKLAKGDVVHISANTPHQLSIPKGHSFTYFVVKIKE